MESLEVVQAHIRAAVPSPRAGMVPLRDALGLVLAGDIAAGEAVPPFANTAMDGYAVRAADTTHAPVRLRVVGDLAAGHAPTTRVGAGDAIRIMTGAPMPPGADAIVMVERTERDGDDGVTIQVPAALGDHIRHPGGDVAEGDAVFAAGAVLTPAHLGVLASLGFADVPAYPRIRVGVISTGDELREGPGVLAPGQIRDSNRPMMVALVREAGCDAVDLGIGRDDEAAVTAMFRDAAASCDAIITTGGVSVGDYDVVKAVLDQLGVLEWWQVSIKPAKPLAFARIDGTPVFGLPGNPVSSHVSFELFARPALRQMMGHPEVDRPVVTAIAGEAMPRRADGKLYFDRVRVRYDGDRYVAVRSGTQASNVLSGMALANGLALLPDGPGIDAGAPLQVMLLT
ncbi:MAG: molybdopterin molybdotransferase MoeA [Acidimicrobiia bacterium]|nr:molybdopterin molybdotransferase MoeA [Acidimicrobiia bacterium]